MRLKELRIKNGYNQKELAEKLNCAQNTISNWESGKRGIDAETLLHLADFYGVSTDYILGRHVNPENPTDPLQNKLISIFTSLNDLGKLEAIKRIDELSQLPMYQGVKLPVEKEYNNA